MRAAAVLGGVAATVLVVIGVSDALYWGRPFHSLFAIVDYTLVQRLSSRGYEPPWYYLTHLSEWSDVLLVVLACLAWQRTSRSALLWAALPLALLSVLPHKEARYAIATIPFWALAAAPALRAWIAHGYVRTPHPVHVRVGALGIALLVAAAVAFDAGKFRFVRSEAAVRLGWVDAAIGSDRDRGRAALAIRRAPVRRRVDAAHRTRPAGARRRAPAARGGVPAGRAWAALRLRPLAGRTRPPS